MATAAATTDPGPRRPRRKGPTTRDDLVRRDLDLLARKAAGASYAELAREAGLSRGHLIARLVPLREALSASSG